MNEFLSKIASDKDDYKFSSSSVCIQVISYYEFYQNFER
jgi:hypothetical protein